MKAAMALAMLALACSVGARACEPGRGYRIPFNFELVENADLIVLARVKSGPATPWGFGFRPPAPPNGPPVPSRDGVILAPLQVLKGRLPPGALRVVGFTTDRGRPVLPAPTKLNEAHPSSYEGACVRQLYPVGDELIAMFRLTPSGPAALNYPFARQMEDVESTDGVWVRAVRLYVGMLSYPTGKARRAALAAAARSLLSNPSDRGGIAIARDIRSYLTHRGYPGDHWSVEPGGVWH